MGVFVGIEMIVHCGFTLCGILNVEFWLVFLISVLMALVSVFLFGCFSEEPTREHHFVALPMCETILSAVALWRDPKIWLVCFTNLSFGFSASWLNGYVNAHFQKMALGSSKYVGFNAALTASITAVSAKLYCRVHPKFRLACISWGSSCFLAVAGLSLVTWPNDEGPGGWGWGILVFYILQGLGRGVYESTNKTVFADMFPDDKTAGAFANCMMQSTTSSAIGFMLQGLGVFNEIVRILIVCSLITIPAYIFAEHLHRAHLLELSESITSHFTLARSITPMGGG